MTTKIARLDFRVSKTDKRLIESAASLSGQSLSDFALSVLRAGALQVREQYERTRLTERDRDLFLAIVDNERPNEALKRAALKYVSDVEQGGPGVDDPPT
jgi:uncharacterized protein (DUF1778 family)